MHVTAFVGDGSGLTNLDVAANTGVLDIARVPDLDASKITSGVLDAARVPDLDAGRVASGVFDPARIPVLAPASVPVMAIPLFGSPDFGRNDLEYPAGAGHASGRDRSVCCAAPTRGRRRMPGCRWTVGYRAENR